jgi:hypothetical protein
MVVTGNFYRRFTALKVPVDGLKWSFQAASAFLISGGCVVFAQRTNAPAQASRGHPLAFNF